VIAALVLAALLIGPGLFLLVQRETGPRATATVSNCRTSGSGRSMRTHCTGSWIVGGSLLAGGHVVVGTIQGLDQTAAGTQVDVTLRGDEAYSRALSLPVLLIGLGLIPFALLLLPRFRKKRLSEPQRR
jgi:hypothetical protein